MQVQIQVKGLPGSSKLCRFAAHKLKVALSRFSHAIQDANMRLDDIHGPERGGVDKLCCVVLKMKNNSIIVIEDWGTDMAQMIDRVVDRLHQSVSRQMSRLVKIDRSGMRQDTSLLAGA